MSDQSRKIISGLAAGLGAALATVGFMQLMRWLQLRGEERPRYIEHERRDQLRQRESARYQPHDQPDRQQQPIPTTGERSVAMADLVDDVMQHPDEEQLRTVEQSSLGSAPPVSVTEQAEPLAQYLLALYSMVELIRDRRRENGEPDNGHSISPTERRRIVDALDRVEGNLPAYSEDDLEDGSLQERIYHLRVKVRDALENTIYTDADLFRINGEVRTQVCSLADEIETAGGDFSGVRQAYECD